MSCLVCGEVVKCPHCDVSLSLHKNNRMYCHYCGFSMEKPMSCPNCGNKHIYGLRGGTQKVETEVNKLFPSARVLRMDADSTKGKDGHEKILAAFANKEADILVGTQMIVKGHDFPDVTLVGILAADLSLNVGDFRSAERTFDLITQAAGRAGRGEYAGNVVIQSYRPDHYSVEYAAAQDYDGFYEREINYRRLLSYPPIGHMSLIMLLSRDEKEVIAVGEEIASMLEGLSMYSSGLITPSISKIKDVYRRMIYLKSENTKTFIEVRKKIDSDYSENKKVTIYYDTDPMSM